MMKRTLKLIKDEKGQVFPLVLILLLLGGLIIGPLLAFMGTGLKAGQALEWRMTELYAADAGIDDALWKIMNVDPIPTGTYPLWVNSKDVAVTIPSDDDEEITFFINLGILKDTSGNYNKQRPHQDWLLVYAPLVDDDGMCYEYRITALYVAGGQPRLSTTGFWIYEYDEYGGSTAVVPYDDDIDNHLAIDLDGDGAYLPYDVDGDGVPDVNEADITTEPLINPGYTNFEDEDGIGMTEIRDYWGRAFIWKWPNQGPRLGQGVTCRTQRFALDPAIPFAEFPPNVAWIGTDPNSIQISWFGDITGMDQIIAVATDPDTGRSTAVESYVFVEQVIQGGPITTTILTWEIKLQ